MCTTSVSSSTMPLMLIACCLSQFNFYRSFICMGVWSQCSPAREISDSQFKFCSVQKLTNLLQTRKWPIIEHVEIWNIFAVALSCWLLLLCLHVFGDRFHGDQFQFKSCAWGQLSCRVQNRWTNLYTTTGIDGNKTQTTTTSPRYSKSSTNSLGQGITLLTENTVHNFLI